MTKYFLFFWALCMACCSSNAGAQAKIYGEGDTKWPGIRFQIFWLERIPPDRLVVGVRLRATTQAPAAGTLIGHAVPIPAGLTPEQMASGDYVPRPFSLASSTMIDETTQQQYPTLPNIAAHGKEYSPSQGLATLTPGQIVDFIIQFKVPPPPEPSQPLVKQTVSFLLSNAKDAIKNIPLPPPAPVAPTSQ